LHALLLASCFGWDLFSAGASWTYSGTRLWTEAASSRVDSGAVRWRMSVEQARTIDGTSVLLIRGFVGELAWSDPTTPPRLSILVCRGNRLSHLAFGSDAEARSAANGWNDSLLVRAEVILEEPLRPGTVFGQTPPRDDEMYGWLVEAAAPRRRIRPGCGSSALRGYRLTMRTLPDHQIVEWQDGVGITAYTYVHHGTPAAATVQLASCSLRVNRVEG
jgi:hypothetical protein